MTDYIAHITPPGGNVFADLGFEPEEAAQMKAAAQQVVAAKLALMDSVAQWMRDNDLKQAQAAQILRVSRPRLSDVVNHKQEKFTLDALVTMLAHAGKRVEWSIG